MLEFKRKKKKYLFGANSIANEYYEEEREFIILQKPFINLKHLFDQRTEEFEDDNLLDVIPDNLLTEYDKNENLYGKYSFQTLIIELAKLRAISNTHRIFGLNYYCYKLMHLLNDFSQFQIKGLNCRNCQGLHEELRLRYYEPQKIKKEEPKREKEQEIETSDFFKIKEEYYEKFLSKEFYKYLTKNFIEGGKTSHNAFKNTFTKEPKKHKSELYFFCKNQISFTTSL